MTCRITVKYNYNTDETRIKISSDFESLPDIHQLDALRDALYELKIIYNAKLSRFNRQKPVLVKASTALQFRD